MSTRLIRRAVIAAAVLAPTLGSVLAAPATAATTHWVYDSDILTIRSASWTSLGQRPGLPGNAHSGDLFLETDEGPATIDRYDWSCPAGVRPSDGSGCTLLREQFIQAPLGAFEGPLRYRLRGQTEIQTWTDDTDWTVSTGYADVTFVRTGPVSSTTTVSDDLKVVTLSAAMRMTGHLGATWFGDPTLEQAVGPYTHALYFTPS